MTPETKFEVSKVLAAFDKLNKRCEHLAIVKTVCAHPDVELYPMACTPRNCPLLLEGKNGKT